MAGNMNIHVDLSEDVQKELIETYEGFCESLKKMLGKMHGDLEKICEKTHYEPMVNIVNRTIEYLTEDIKNTADQALNEWMDGDGSFVKAAEHSQAGGDAEAIAREIEKQICGAYEDFWNPNPMGDGINVSTDRPIVEGQDFDNLAEEYQKASEEIESAGEDVVKKLKEQGEESPTYSILIPAVIALYKPLQTAFEKFKDNIADAKGESQDLATEQRGKNEEAATETQTIASAAEISDALKMFDNL